MSKGNIEAPLGLGEVVADGVADKVRRGTQVELVHRAGTVGFDRLHADVEDVADLLVDLALGDQLDHLPLAVGEATFELIRLRL